MENIPKNYDQIDQWKSTMFLYSSALNQCKDRDPE